MAGSVAKAGDALERLNYARPGGVSAKASLRPHTPACSMREDAREAVKRTTKQEQNGAGLSQSRLSHKLSDGTLMVKEMEALGPAFAAEWGRMLLERYAPLVTPQARMRENVRVIRQRLDELDQLAELVQ